jgi:hypothetical protein
MIPPSSLCPYVFHSASCVLDLTVYLTRFFYKPVTLSALAIGLTALAYVAMSQDVLAEGRDKRRVQVSL